MRLFNSCTILALIVVTSAHGIFVKPIGCTRTDGPYGLQPPETVVGLQAAIDGLQDYDEIRVLPGIYWEAVNVTNLGITRTTKVITGWNPDLQAPEYGTPADGDFAEQIRIKAALHDEAMSYDSERGCYDFLSENNLPSCKVYTGEIAWKLRNPDNPHNNEFVFVDNNHIRLFCDDNIVSAGDIAIVPESGFDYGIEINIPEQNPSNDLTVMNLTIEHGSYGATSIRSDYSFSDRFENVRFYNSYRSEFRIETSNIAGLVFDQCRFVKTSPLLTTQVNTHVVFDDDPNNTLTYYQLNDVQFQNCTFRIHELAPGALAYAFSKTPDAWNPGAWMRVYDIDSLAFRGCDFSGEYSSAISLQQDWLSPESTAPEQCRIRNVTIEDCQFTNCATAVDLFPPVQHVSILDNHFTGCDNGINVRRYTPNEGLTGVQEHNAISSGIFTDHLLISGNRFSEIGIWNPDTLISHMREIKNDVFGQFQIIPNDAVVQVRDAVILAIGSVGFGVKISGRLTDLVLHDNHFNHIGRCAISLQNANEDAGTSRDDVQVTLNHATECLGTNYILCSSWMTAEGNTTSQTGTTNANYVMIDYFYDDLSDTLRSFANNGNITKITSTETTVAIGISIHPATIWGETGGTATHDVREITVANNSLLGCTAQGILTEGTANDLSGALEFYRVRDVILQGNRIWTRPYAYHQWDWDTSEEGQWVEKHTVYHLPTLWVSDTDNCQVLDNRARCDSWTSSEPDSVLSAGVGIIIDGCDGVRVEGNHFHGLSEAFRLRVDNQNGNADSPNSARNRDCVLQDNAFTGLRRDASMGPYLFSQRSNPLLSIGYQEKFEHLPPSTVSALAFQGNLIQDNIIQLVTAAQDVLTLPDVPATFLNYPLAAWPGPDSTFFDGHNCANQVDNPNDLNANFLQGNYINMLDNVESEAHGNRISSGMRRREHEGFINDCHARALSRYDYSLRRDGDYPNEAMRLDNSWNCAFDSVGVAAVPELGNFPLLAPVLRVPEDFVTLQEAVDFAAAHPTFQPAIRVSTAQLPTMAGNVDVVIPTGYFRIQSADTTRLDARGQNAWFRLLPGAQLVLEGFRLRSAGGPAPAIQAQTASLILRDCQLSQADSLHLEDTDCTLEDDSRWRNVQVHLQGNAMLAAHCALDWREVAVDRRGSVDAGHRPLLELKAGGEVPSLLAQVTFQDGDGNGLEVLESPVMLAHCRVEDCAGAGLMASLGSIVSDLDGRYQRNGTGMALLGTTVSAELSGTRLEENVGDGLWASSADLLKLAGLHVRANGASGVALQNADARLEACRIEANGAHGIKADHSRVDLSEFAANTLAGNSAAPLFVLGAEPYLICGHNAIVGTSVCLVEGDAAVDSLWSFQFNYWGAEGPAGRICLSPANWQLYPVCEDTCRVGSECIAASVPRNLLQQAAEWETLHEWLLARNTYQTIPEPWPTCEEATSALHGVYRCTIGGKLDLEVARIYFTYIAERFPSTALAKVAEDLAIRCKGAGGERMAAAGDFLSLATTTPEDSLANLRKAVVLATEAVLLGELDKGGGTDALAGLPVFADLQTLTAWLRDPASSPLELVEALPADFDLGTPWPNPFNPIVHFELALPEAARVTLRIHNLLGQRVRQLEQAALPAGRHARRWDGTGEGGRAVASGVYLLSVEARGESGRSWSKAEKLLLVR